MNLRGFEIGMSGFYLKPKSRQHAVWLAFATESSRASGTNATSTLGVTTSG